MGNEREFKIKITTSADTGGINETGESLGGLTAETQKYIQQLKGAGDAGKKLELTHHELRGAVRLLGQSFGELGAIAGEALLLSPVMAGLAALAAVIAKVVEAVNEAKAAISERVDLSNWDALTAKIREAEDTIKTAGESAALFYDKIERLAHAQEDLGKKTDAAVAAIERQAEIEKKGMDAREKLELAKVDALAKAGIITAEQAAQKKTAIEDDYAKRGADTADQKERDVLKARLKERARIAAAKPEQDAARNTAQNAATNSANALAHQKKEIEAWEDKLKALKEYAEKHGKSLTDEEWGDERAKKHLAETKLEGLRGSLPQAERSDIAARARLDEADKAIEDAAKRKRALDEQIPRMEADMAAAQAGRRTEVSSGQQTRAIQDQAAAAGSPLGKLIASVAGSEHTLQTGGRIGPAEQAQINVLQQMLAQKDRGDPKTLEILGKLVGHDEQLFTQIAALAKRLDGIQKRQTNTFNQ